MVDKNGKLFGKINLIDFIIVLILIALVAFVVFKFIGRNDNDTALTQVRMSFYSDEVPEFVVDALEEGTSVLDSGEDVTLGTLESFKSGAPLGFETDTDGEIKAVTRKGYKSLSLNVLANAEMTEHGVKIGGVLYGVGHTLTIYAGKAKIYIKVSAIQPVA
ncbi:MAG: DUF4330 domain-containing protein [Clostridiales bacterium]|jgi:hypothetical protein|nr:DUF4330 domain-containing protein [Clostridiales bacterium]